MDNKLDRPGRWCMLSIACVSLFGIVAQLCTSSSLGSALNLFSYFTIQSNLIVVAVCLYGGLARKRGAAYPAWRCGTTLWILVTGLVFSIFLASHSSFRGIGGWANLALHYVAPSAVLLEWLFLEPKGAQRARHVLYWLAYPLGYAALSLVRGAIDGFYPYWFLDPTESFPRGVGGYAPLALFVLGLAICIGAVGLALYVLDSALAKRARARAS